MLGLFVSLAATVRLAAVVAATPERLWLVEYPRFVDFAQPASAAVRLRADAVAEYITDPSLFHARQTVCANAFQAPASDNGASGDVIDACLRVIDEALMGNPASGELWLLRANVLLRAEGIGEPVFDALRHSYQSTPREGWIAAERIVLGLRLYPLFPSDLQTGVASDLEIVLADRQLAQPLIDAYPDEFALRKASGEALRLLPPDLLNRFVDLVQEKLNQ